MLTGPEKYVLAEMFKSCDKSPNQVPGILHAEQSLSVLTASLQMPQWYLAHKYAYSKEQKTSVWTVHASVPI